MNKKQHLYNLSLFKIMIAMCIVCLAGIIFPKNAYADSTHYLYPYQATNTNWYKGDSENSFSMMGTSYSRGLTVDSRWNNTYFAFNVSGTTSVSFIVGHIDGGYTDSRTMKVYLDDTLLENYTTSLTGDMINKSITIDTTGATQLYIYLEGGGNYGLANITETGRHNFVSEITKISTVKADGELRYTCSNCNYSYTEKIAKQDTCNPYLFPYQTSNMNTYNYPDNSSTYFEVMDKKYYKGIIVDSRWNNSSALYNLNYLYKTFTFTIGHTDGGYTNGRTLYVYVDGIEMKKIPLSGYMINETYTINVEGASQVKLYLEGEGHYSIVDVTAEPVKKVTKAHSFEEEVTVAAQFGSTGIITHKCKDCGAFYTSISPALKRNLKDIDCNITLAATSYTYSGKSYTPTVKATYGDTTLKKGTDYTVTYLNNKNPGKATVKITGKGNYTGVVNKVFTIKKITPKITNVSNVYYKVYGSKAFKLNAKASNNARLTYTSSNKNIASLSGNTVKITGCGTVTITIKTTASTYYNAAVKKVTITVKPKKAVLNKVTSPSAAALKVFWKKDAKASGYEIRRSRYSDMSYYTTFTIDSANTTNYLITSCWAREKYYVRVYSFTTVGGTKVYSDGSAIKSTTTKGYY